MKSIQEDAIQCVEQIVQKVRPDLTGPAFYIKSGWENLAFGVGNNHIVRVPKDIGTLEVLRREEQVCQYVLALAPPLETPDLAVHEVDGYSFSLHRKIGSALFTRAKYDNLTGVDKDEAANKLAVFFKLMHGTPLNYAETELGAEKRPGPSCYQRIAQTIEEKLDPDLKEFGHAIVRAYRERPTEKQQLVFGHFDLHDGNVGADSSGRLAGAFDFADCAIGDVHDDFAPLFYISPDLAYRTVARYVSMTGKDIDPRRVAVAGAMREILDLAGERKSPEPDEFFNQKLNEWRVALSHGGRSSDGSLQHLQYQ